MKVDIESVREKLRALRERTVENGCTEEEAVAAAEKAAELLTKYGLSDDDLADADYSTAEIPIGKRTVLDRVWGCIADFCDCACWYDRADTGTKFCFFGRAQDVLVAEYIYEVMKGAIGRALVDFRSSPIYQNRRKASARSRVTKAFLEGIAISLTRKLHEGLWKRNGDQWQTALVTTRASMEMKAQQVRGLKLKATRALERADGAAAREARYQGWAAGKEIEVNAGVTAGGKVAGLLR